MKLRTNLKADCVTLTPSHSHVRIWGAALEHLAKGKWSCHSLATFVIAIAVVMGVSLSASGSEPAPLPTLNLTSDVGWPGATVIVSGSGYACGTACAYGIYWNGVHGSTLIGTFSSSSFQTTVAIPNTRVAAPTGCYLISTRSMAPDARDIVSATYTVLGRGSLNHIARRKAVDLLEEVRNTSMAPNWSKAILGPNVRQLYTPDLSSMYYEFPVVTYKQGPTLNTALSGSFTRTTPSDEIPTGFIIVSSACQDFAIPHWSDQGLPPTKRLDQTAQAAGRPAPARYYKVDTLSYAAEDSGGNYVADIGGLPPKVSGIDPAWLNQHPFPFSSTDWVLQGGTVSAGDDSTAGAYSRHPVTSGPGLPSSLVLGAWSSWTELKTDYAAVYSVYNEGLRRAAREDWFPNALINGNGRSMVGGQTYSVSFLYPGASFSIKGDGYGLIKDIRSVNRPGLLPLLTMTVADYIPQNSTVEIRIRYRNGSSEILKLFLLAFASPSDQPHKDGWENWLAGTNDDQRMYDQIPRGRGPNTSECLTGCGPTAWAMLFGWTDYRVSVGDPAWKPYWGIYRENGSKNGPDAQAPKEMCGSSACGPSNMLDTGVMNMIWDIHEKIGGLGVICNFTPFGDPTEAATLPSDMGDGGAYLNGRSFAKAHTDWTWRAWPEDWLFSGEPGIRDQASDAIKGNKAGGAKPAIVGIGFYHHYALAWGFARHIEHIYYNNPAFYQSTAYYEKVDRSFHVNMGHGGFDDDWIPTGIWFVGTLSPK